MYVLNKDIPNTLHGIDTLLYSNNVNDIKETIVILDIRYFKTFTTKSIIEILSLGNYDEMIESIFLNVCISSILSNTRDICIFDLTNYTAELLVEVLHNNAVVINEITLKEKLYLYLDVLKNNIDYMLDNMGLEEYIRIADTNIMDTLHIDKFYVVKDLSLDLAISEIRSNSLYIKTYEKEV